MRIYKLEQMTWNNGGLGDFDLPKCLGHFQTRQSAENILTTDIVHKGLSQDDSWTTEKDYRITEIEVKA